MNVSDTLNLAADHIETRGWRRGVGWNYNDGQPVCLEGGVLAAMGLGWNETRLEEFYACPAYQAVQRYLDLPTDVSIRGKDEYPSPEQPLWQWNDAEGRTATEVVEVLRATALIEASREKAVSEASA